MVALVVDSREKVDRVYRKALELGGTDEGPAGSPVAHATDDMSVNSFANVRVGAVGTATTVVTRELTVAHIHAEMPEVYGAPF